MKLPEIPRNPGWMRHDNVVPILVTLLVALTFLRAAEPSLPPLPAAGGPTGEVQGAAPGRRSVVIFLKNGFHIQASEIVEQEGEVRLRTASGEIVLPREAVASYEPGEAEPAAAPHAEARDGAGGITPELPPTPIDPRRLLDEAALRYGLPAELLHSIARVESGYRQDAVSPKGARGIMQLMPATAASLKADPNDAGQNVDAGARHIRDLLIRYEGATAKALAAYNAGAGAVQRYGGIPPYRETQLYVQKVLENYWRLHRQAGKTGAGKQP